MMNIGIKELIVITGICLTALIALAVIVAVIVIVVKKTSNKN